MSTLSTALSSPTQAVCAKEYCNVAAQALDLDPAGHAGHFEDAVLVETPLPWKRELYEKAGALPQEMIDLLALWLDRYRAGQPYNHRPLLIAPDAAYSRAGYRRVIFFSRPSSPFSHFERAEYCVPEAEVGPLVWALYEGRDELPRFAPYLQIGASENGLPRDLLVCTHGTIDAACAKFGYPLYRLLRERHAHDSLRVWRVSHFGGHVFAPTLLEMPTGHYWAYVGEAQADQIAMRRGEVSTLRGHYRGWAGVASGFAQAAEREAWMREGWAWFGYAKSCRVTAADTDDAAPRWMELCIDFTRPDGVQGCYAARVEVGETIRTRPHTNRPEDHAYAQYVVSQFEHSLL